MRKLVGKRVTEVVCPLCLSQYIMSFDEITEESDEKVNFYCDECDRRVRLEIKDRAHIRERFIPNWFDWENEEEYYE